MTRQPRIFTNVFWSLSSPFTRDHTIVMPQQFSSKLHVKHDSIEFSPFFTVSIIPLILYIFSAMLAARRYIHNRCKRLALCSTQGQKFCLMKFKINFKFIFLWTTTADIVFREWKKNSKSIYENEWVKQSLSLE